MREKKKSLMIRGKNIHFDGRIRPGMFSRRGSRQASPMMQARYYVYLQTLLRVWFGTLEVRWSAWTVTDTRHVAVFAKYASAPRSRIPSDFLDSMAVDVASFPTE
jgi:hypothetical protein